MDTQTKTDAPPGASAKSLTASNDTALLLDQHDTENLPDRPVLRFPFTDVGNAERFVRRHQNAILYCSSVNKWLYWDGTRWLWLSKEEIKKLAMTTARAIPEEAVNVEDSAQHNGILVHALKSESYRALQAMLSLAQAFLHVPIEKLDSNPSLLGVANGVIDLRSGYFRPAQREDRITKQANVTYDPNAICARWIKFLEEIFAADKQLIAFVQRLVGYCLTGDTREQCMFIFFGSGANGKSVVLRVLHALLGDYAMQSSVSAFMQSKSGNGPSNDIARLRGARLVTAAELDEGCILAEGVIKQLTGQDTIACRFLYQEFFSYEPQFKIILATNHKPGINGDDYAIWRRIRLIPFSARIPPERQDKELADKLITDELPGILNWALAGLREWQEIGLAPPSAVDAATQDYRNEMDIFGDWLNDCCITSPDLGHIPTAKLYESYKRFCADGDLRTISSRAFGRKLAERGFDPAKGTGGIRGFRGLSLKSRKPIGEVVREGVSIIGGNL